MVRFSCLGPNRLLTRLASPSAVLTFELAVGFILTAGPERSCPIMSLEVRLEVMFESLLQGWIYLAR